MLSIRLGRCGWIYRMKVFDDGWIGDGRCFWFLRVWVGWAGDGGERGAVRRFARAPTHPCMCVPVRVCVHMRDPCRLFLSSPFAGDLSSKWPSSFKRGSMSLGNGPISEVVPAFDLVYPASWILSAPTIETRQPVTWTIARYLRRFSRSLPSWSSPSWASSSPQSPPQREKWPCRRWSVHKPAVSGWRGKARQHANSTVHHKFCLHPQMVPKCTPNGILLQSNCAPNGDLLLPNALQMVSKWIPNGTQMQSNWVPYW